MNKKSNDNETGEIRIPIRQKISRIQYHVDLIKYYDDAIAFSDRISDKFIYFYPEMAIKMFAELKKLFDKNKREKK